VYLLVTIDAEAVHGKSPLEQMMWGRLKGFEGEYGIGLIADICEKNNIKATFFLDVYEHSYYGKDALKEVALYLDKRGHDVQLHTHPAWYQDKRDFPEIQKMKRERSCFSANKYWMNLNSFEEQVEILRHGKALLEDWLGKPVIAHRAGSYAVDINTIYALKEVGILIDSSMCYGHSHSKVTWSKNLLIEKYGIFEVPVTVFSRNTRWHWGLYKQNKGTLYVKTDINWCSANDLKNFVVKGIQNGLPVLDLFLHSYSLVKFDRYFTHFAPDEDTKRKLDEFLAFCASGGEIELISIGELRQLFKRGLISMGGEDFVPVAEDRCINVYGKTFERVYDESRRIVDTLTGVFHQEIKI
jgi:peptidoglycan/xylan/chitin deacetylase (PgdA/CDA1 family)